ncbi:hypothetical protein BJV78DRAFT_1151084 [Lactifluus subvellereus]|nr:hypothetical protein BJV78DRAFT_1151084 [Lactifluus subvellereus]
MHYLVPVVPDIDFRYVPISAKTVPDSSYQSLIRVITEDTGWPDVERICGRGREVRAQKAGRVWRSWCRDVGRSQCPKLDATTVLADDLPDSDWKLWSYANSILTAAHTKVEKQLKRPNIPYSHVYPPSLLAAAAPINTVSRLDVGPLHTRLSQAIPALIQSSDLLCNSAAYDAAILNIRVVPLAWWAPGVSAKGPKVVMRIKLCTCSRATRCNGIVVAWRVAAVKVRSGPSPARAYFGRLPSREEVHNHRPNPHEEVEPFLHALLRQGRLAGALPALVIVLRDTVPVLEVLARIPARAAPKAVGGGA